ncbi:MAG: HAMP domain-containing histidine kinase, partial [Cyclobacteriaceae bacterium]|nr:HAMP domain-containing histidine kinase [Cyclobacteriaceae bacterium]
SNCVIEVSDNGIGISEDYLPKIFEMFFRATEEFSGSGIGLYIVKETVEKLKGTIKVKSKTRQGSTFKIVLPNLKDRYDAAP